MDSPSPSPPGTRLRIRGVRHPRRVLGGLVAIVLGLALAVMVTVKPHYYRHIEYAHSLARADSTEDFLSILEEHEGTDAEPWIRLAFARWLYRDTDTPGSLAQAEEICQQLQREGWGELVDQHTTELLDRIRTERDFQPAIDSAEAPLPGN